MKPHEAAGKGGGAADVAVLFRHDHLEPMRRRDGGRRQTAGA